jgi:hypothetical protein
VNVKLVSENYWLHMYRLFSVLACYVLQGSLSATSWVLRQNETKEYRNETLVNMVNILCCILMQDEQHHF